MALANHGISAAIPCVLCRWPARRHTGWCLPSVGARLPFGRNLRVQVAATAAGAVTPAGTGGLALHVLIGGPLLIASVVTTMFGVNQQISVWSTIAVAPIFFWELSLGVWLTVKGFNTTSPVLTELQKEPAALAIS